VPVKPLVGVVSVAFVFAIGGCGGGGAGDSVATTTKSSTPTTTEPTSGNGNTAAAETPEVLAACLEEAGYAPTVIPAPPEGVPGSEFGSIGSVRVDVSQNNGVAAVFFESAKKAEELSKGIGKSLSPKGTAEVIGAVYLSATRDKPKELGAFRTCLEG
jgi:hypothetical protein